MITTPTILIGIANNKMNKLIYSKNEIYYYLVGEVIRKRLCNLFDALGNISSYNDYYCFTKKYSQFKQFSFCYASVLLNYTLNEKQGMVIAIDNVTHELYLPSKNEFNCISLGYHYPHLVCHAKENNYIEADNKKYKKLMKVVLAELTDKMYRSYMKKEIENLMNQVIQEINIINSKTSYVQIESDDSEEYENDFEIDYEEQIEQVKLLEPIEEESLDSVIQELNEVMTITNNHLPKYNNYTPIVLNTEKSLVEFLEVKDEVEQVEEKPLEKSLPSIVEFLEVKDEVEQVDEKPLEKSLPSLVEFLEVKDEVEQVEEKPLEKSITESIIEDIEVEIVKAEETLEENEDEEIQEKKEEVKEPLQSSTLVEEIFQKFQNKPEDKAEVKTEPKKTYNTFWTYLGWK
jgi:hypothetical protein